MTTNNINNVERSESWNAAQRRKAKSQRTPQDLVQLARDLVDVLVYDFPYRALSKRDLENRNAAIAAMEKCLREAEDEASAMFLASDPVTQGWAAAIVDRFDRWVIE